MYIAVRDTRYRQVAVARVTIRVAHGMDNALRLSPRQAGSAEARPPEESLGSPPPASVKQKMLPTADSSTYYLDQHRQQQQYLTAKSAPEIRRRPASAGPSGGRAANRTAEAAPSAQRRRAASSNAPQVVGTRLSDRVMFDSFERAEHLGQQVRAASLSLP